MASNWGAYAGAATMALGAGASYLGEKKGTDALIREQERQNAEQAALDAEQAAAVDRATADLAANPMGMRIGARAGNTLARASAAMPLGARRMAGASAGVAAPRIDQATSRILPGIAPGAVRQASNEASADVGAGLGRMRGEIADTNFRRRNQSRFYHDRLARAGAAGAGLRTTGNLMQLGGGALMTSGLGGTPQPSAEGAMDMEDVELDPFASTTSNVIGYRKPKPKK